MSVRNHKNSPGKSLTEPQMSVGSATRGLHWIEGTNLTKRGKLTGLIFFTAGAVLAWGFVAHGVAAVGSVPPTMAAVIATVTVGIQLLILFDGKHFGRKIGTSLLVFYLVLTTLNVVLAAAGVSSSVLKDQLGRASVVRSLGSAQTQIKSVTDALSSVSTEAQRAADASERQQELEAVSGGSCAAPDQAPSPKGIGPIARMRDADRALFANLAADADRLTSEMRAANQTVEQALNSYSAERHDEAIAAVRKALDQARANAAASRDIKRQAVTRLAEWQAGQPVACNDAELQARINALANANYPLVADIGELPSAPSPNSAARGLIEDTAGIFSGRPFDLGMWGVPLVGGILPDVLLILGFMMFTYNPDNKKGLRDDDEILAERLGLAPKDAPLMDEALKAAALDPDWQALLADLVSAGGRFMRVNRLYVAPDDWARLRRLHVLARRGLIYDVGVADGFHVFILRPAYLHHHFDQIVRRIVEQIRSAASGAEDASPEETA